MVLTLPSGFKTLLESNSVEEFRWLCEFHYVSSHPTLGGTVDYMHLGPGSITFNSNTYSEDVGHFSTIKQELQQNLPAFSLKLHNIDKRWSTRHQAGDLNESEIRIRLVASTLLSDNTAQISEISWHVDGYSIDRAYINFNLGSPISALGHSSPVGPLFTGICLFAYKDHHCLSQSTLPTCNKTIADCAARHGILRHSHGPDFENLRPS